LGSAPREQDPWTIPDLSQRINAFSLDFLKRCARSPDAAPNAVLSPQGIFQGLAMSYVASGGQTRKELAEVLHFPQDDQQLIDDLKRLRLQVKSAAKDRRIEASVANAVWLDGTYAEFRKEYRERMEKAFGASLHQAKFGDADNVSNEINRWASKETNGRIREVIRPADLRSQSTPGVIDEPGLVTVNAVYFKADWGSRFEADATRDLPFHVDRQRTRPAPMMHQRSLLLYAADDQCEFLEIPYVDGRFSMYVLLPREILPLAKLADPLSADGIARLRRGATPHEVDVLFPKFDFPTHIHAKSTLDEMGVKAAFDKGRADFDRMIVKKYEAYLVYVSDVLQDAFIEVHEKGTEAAAVTTGVHFSIGCSAGPPRPPRVDFHADHPFVYAIVHNESRSVLFAGWITDPKGPEGDGSSLR
jgi:serpin B